MVVARHTWAALQGRRKLKIVWDLPENPEGSPELNAKLEAALDREGKSYRSEGDIEAALASAPTKLTARYRTPFLVHAPMEPPACTALVTDTGCEIWAPTQNPQRARSEAAKTLGLSESKVTVHVTLLGGGFGRKSQPDFVLEAVAIAAELKGKPVKLTWTREDEIRHGFYHAESAHRLDAGIDVAGKLVAWRHRSAFPTIQSLFTTLNLNPGDFEMKMGATTLPYAIPNLSVEGVSEPSEVRIAWLRAVCNLFHSFAINSFLDEIAHAKAVSPVDLRLQLLKPHGILPSDAKSDFPLDTGRMARVIEKVATASEFSRPRKKGMGVGFASHFSFFSYVAAAVEAQVVEGNIQVTAIDCSIDCGRMVNPDTVRAQMEGAMVFGLSLALHGKITLDKGVVRQSGFHDYPLLRMAEMPKIRVHLIESEAHPAGVGEPGVPPVAPALANAVFAATGKRLRELPLRL
ncbi:MAG: molybdopterin cofactor-binding domain-containing protein [Bdellovibrionota bacterium]